jgi:hypothetical protein
VVLTNGIAAGAAPYIYLTQDGNVNGGVTLAYVGAPEYASDPFPCGGTDPRTLEAPERTFTLNLVCDKSVTSGLAIVVPDWKNLVPAWNGPFEQTTCQYVVTARTKAACPSAGDPFSDP